MVEIVLTGAHPLSTMKVLEVDTPTLLGTPQPPTSKLVLAAKACTRLLERYIPPTNKEKLLVQSFKDCIRHFSHATIEVRP